MPELCRYAEYLVFAAALNSVEPDVSNCAADATHRAVIEAERHGLSLRVDVPVCTPHERVLSAAPAHNRSIPIRRDGMAHLYDCCSAAPTEPHRDDCALSTT